jgi:hypothetical protein
MSSIFLSHSSRDNFEAVALRDWLAREGWDDVFLDLDPDRGIAARERWERSLYEQANRCEAVIFLVSANWLASGWCLREYVLARTLNKKLFAVVIDPTKSIADLPPELKGTWQAVELTGGQDGVLLPTQLPGSHEERQVVFSRDGLRRLKRGLDKAGLDPKFFALPPEGDRERAPYRGLKSLEAADAGIFFLAPMTLRRPARLSDDGESGRENFPARRTLKIHKTGKLSLPRPRARPPRPPPSGRPQRTPPNRAALLTERNSHVDPSRQIGHRIPAHPGGRGRAAAPGVRLRRHGRVRSVLVDGRLSRRRSQRL